MGCLLWLSLVLAGWLPAAGKVEVRKVRLGKNPREELRWQFVGKFGYSVGSGQYGARVRAEFPKWLPEGTQLEFETYLDEEWPLAEAISDPCERKRHSRRTRDILLGGEGNWGPWANGSIRQTVRPHVWYFAMSDCNRSLANLTFTLQLYLEYRQDGGSHFSVEQQWSLVSNVVLLLFFSGFLWNYWRRTYAFNRSIGSVHPVIWTLAAVICAQYLAQCLHTGHLAMYRSDGRGSHIMDLMSDVLFMLSQVVHTSLLILIALGYTLLQSKLGDLEIVLPICILVAVGHILLVVVDKVQDEAAHRFTEHEGAKGWILLVLRLILFAWFWWAAGATAKESGSRVRAFLRHFRLAGALYFLAYPVTFCMVCFIAPYYRKPVMESGLMVAQVGSNIWLASLFLDRGSYFEASSLSASPLPGAGSPVRFFKDD